MSSAMIGCNVVSVIDGALNVGLLQIRIATMHGVEGEYETRKRFREVGSRGLMTKIQI
jgi:hypothetical protein